MLFMDFYFKSAASEVLSGDDDLRNYILWWMKLKLIIRNIILSDCITVTNVHSLISFPYHISWCPFVGSKCLQCIIGYKSLSNWICWLVIRKGIKGIKSWVSGIESHLAVDVFFLAISMLLFCMLSFWNLSFLSWFFFSQHAMGMKWQNSSCASLLESPDPYFSGFLVSLVT